MDRYTTFCLSIRGFPGGASQCRRHKKHGFNPWAGKIPWKRAWQPIPVFLPGESPRAEEPGGYSAWGHKESDMTYQLSTQTVA